MACPFGCPEQIRVGWRRIVEVMDGVGVVGENGEVRRRRRHGCQALGDRLSGRITGGIAVGWHEEQTLDRWVRGNRALYRCDVRPLRRHFNRNHADAEPLEHKEVSIVTGHGHDELGLPFAPRRRAAGHAFQHGPHQRVAQECEARVVADQNFLGKHSEQRG